MEYNKKTSTQFAFSTAQSVLVKAIQARAFPGVSWGVLCFQKNLEPNVYTGAAGRFTYEPSATEIQPSTVWDLASITKVAATTTMAMLLHQQGLLNLDTPVGEVLPAFVIGRDQHGLNSASAARHITLRMLLAHSSGLPGYERLYLKAHRPTDLLRACLSLPLTAAPGERAEYSDIGFLLLGKALELIAGDTLDSFTAHRIFAPLGMTETCFNPPRSQRSAIPPTEHDETLRHRIIQGEVQDEHAWIMGGVAGHAGLFANAQDLLRLARHLIETYHGEASHTTLFQRETVHLFAQRPEPPIAPSDSTRALGWDTPSQQGSSAGVWFGPHSIGHLGYAGTSLWIDLEKRVAVALLTNRTWPARESQAIREVRPAFHNAVMQELSLDRPTVPLAASQ